MKRRSFPPRAPSRRHRLDSQARTGPFLTCADLSMETLALPPLAEVAAAIKGGGLKRAYDEAAMADGLARAAAHSGVQAERLQDAEAVRDWAARRRLAQIVSGEAPIGPDARRLGMLEAALANDGVQLVRLRRCWDDVVWPLANKGFFAFKAIIPKLVAG